MRPPQLKPEHFSSYPPLGREVAVRQIELLRQLPLSYVPLLLKEVIAFDRNFPPERREVEAQFTYLGTLSEPQLQDAMRQFAALQLPPEMEQIDWINVPLDFSERLSAQLWLTGQISAFRAAAVEFLNRVHAAVPPLPPEIPRRALVVLGEGVNDNTYRLFRKLRREGTYFNRVNPQDGLDALMNYMAVRTQEHSASLAHWYVDGGAPLRPAASGIEVIAYSEMEPLRSRVAAIMRGQLLRGQATEERGSGLARLGTADFGLAASGENIVTDHFKISVLVEGSGTQFFSTTFVQWSVRELLRRAQPLTILARFAPRMTDLSMNSVLAGNTQSPAFDGRGALVDADMAAYYTWINLMRLTGAADAAFLAWFENHNEAIVVSPRSQRGSHSDQKVTISELLAKLA